MVEKELQARPGFWEVVTSPVGRKILTGITGIVWVGFVILHMLGNLGYFSGSDAYNEYSNLLIELGPLLYFVEFLLVATLLIHVALGISIYVRKRRARAVDYAEYKSMGRPSLQTPSSRTMIFTGLVLLIFLIIHLDTFKFGPGIDQGYVATIEGTQMRDLARLVAEKFQDPVYAFGYTAVMILLGFHLRHGIWSAFQSIGTMNGRMTPIIYAVGTVLAIGIALGFFVLPLYIFFSS